MNIELYEGQGCHLYISLNDDFEVYGGTTKAQFTITKGEEYCVTIPGQTRSMCYDPRFDIFARRTSTGQEWLVVSGRITLKTRYSTEHAGAISCVEYHISKELIESGEVVDGGTMLIGIKGDTGLSAFDIAVQNGFQGTEQEFTNMMVAIRTYAEQAAESQRQSADSAESAANSAGTATTQAATATTQAGIATTKASDAQTAASAAAASSSEAGAYATAAAESEDLARELSESAETNAIKVLSDGQKLLDAAYDAKIESEINAIVALKAAQDAAESVLNTI